MNKLLEIFFEWAKTKERWPLLLLLLIPAILSFTKQYFDLSFRDSLHHWSFLISVGALVALVGLLYFAINPQRLRNKIISVAIALTIIGTGLIFSGIFELKPVILPEDKLVVTIARFTPVNVGATSEAETLPHRIAQELLNRSQGGIPLEVKQVNVSITGSSEMDRRKAAMKLGKSKQSAAHIVLWGDVRKEEGELFLVPYLVVAQPLGKVVIAERSPGQFVAVEPNFLRFKQFVSSQVADLITLMYGLSYYKTSQWDKAIEILRHIDLTEGHLYKALSLKGKYIEFFLKTGDVPSTDSILEESKHELTKSYEESSASNNPEMAALAAIGLGDILRMQNNWGEAIKQYQRGQKLAEQAGQPVYQAKALTGIARVESLGLKRYESAKNYAGRAVQICEKVDDKGELIDALNYLAEAQSYLSEFDASLATLGRALALAQKIGDEKRLFYIYLDRADVYYKRTGNCVSHENVASCLSDLANAKNDFTSALNISKRLEYSGLSKMVEGFILGTQLRRELLIKEKGSN